MTTEEEEDIRGMIVSRLLTAEQSCNSHHITCIKNQVRGLLAALTGDNPTNSDDIVDILQQAGIPFVDHGKRQFDFDAEWMKAHGFTADEDGDYEPIESW